MPSPTTVYKKDASVIPIIYIIISWYLLYFINKLSQVVRI